jgi:hypothetical protein
LEVQSVRFVSFFDFILHTTYTVGVFALTSILPSLSWTDDILYGGHKSDTGVVQGVGIDFVLLRISLLHNVVELAPSLLSNGNQGLFPWGKAAGS